MHPRSTVAPEQCVVHILHGVTPRAAHPPWGNPQSSTSSEAAAELDTECPSIRGQIRALSVAEMRARAAGVVPRAARPHSHEPQALQTAEAVRNAALKAVTDKEAAGGEGREWQGEEWRLRRCHEGVRGTG